MKALKKLIKYFIAIFAMSTILVGCGGGNGSSKTAETTVMSVGQTYTISSSDQLEPTSLDTRISVIDEPNGTVSITLIQGSANLIRYK